MYCEWPITLNCVIITALLFPFIVISVVIIVICVMTALLCVVKKPCARVQRELDFSSSMKFERKRRCLSGMKEDYL